MSAFLINKEHLSFIITWAIDNGTLGGLSPQSWFKEFYDENVESLKSRYPDDYQELIYWDAKSTKYTPTFNAIRPRKYSKQIAIATIKFIRCWEYQSSEYDYNPESLPWRMMKQIKDVAVWEVGYPGDRCHDDHPVLDTSVYDLAPWEYHPKAWKQFLNALSQEKSSTKVK